MHLLQTIALTVLLLAGCGEEKPDAPRAETASTAPAVTIAPPAPVWQASPRLQRVAVVGASASDGFLAQIAFEENGSTRLANLTFSDALRAVLAGDEAQALPHASFQFYTNAEKYGPRLLNAALDEEPTLIVGIDFLFWFGYGYAPQRTPEQEIRWRQNRLTEGLALIEDLPCPAIIGDFPDMTGAAPMMLPPNLIPSQAALEALNQQLREWLEDHDNVTLFPLRDLLVQMKSGERLTIGASEWDEAQTQALLLVDGLHPSAEGLIALALQVADILVREDDACAAEHFVTDVEDVRQRLRAQFTAPAPNKVSPAPVGG
jgi:hypothetical protein